MKSLNKPLCAHPALVALLDRLVLFIAEKLYKLHIWKHHFDGQKNEKRKRIRTPAVLVAIHGPEVDLGAFSTYKYVDIQTDMNLCVGELWLMSVHYILFIWDRILVVTG